MIPESNNQDLIDDLESLPDKVADALETWRRASLDREKLEALLSIRFRGENTERTATEIKHMVNANDDRYAAVLFELTKESEYTRLLEKLLSAKRMAGLRTAF